jgi:hypothetical protein
MPTAVPPQNATSRDLALASIKEALSLIGQVDQEPGRFDDRHKETRETHDFSLARALKAVEKFWSMRRMLQGLVGLCALACVGVVVVAWQSNHGQVASEPVSTASVPKNPSVPTGKTDEISTRPAPNKANLALTTKPAPLESQAQTMPSGAPAAPIAVPIPAELSHQIKEMAREVANMEQGIDQLKTEQSQIAREGTELAEQLKATREAARRNSELSEELKATQAQMARDISNLAGQLKATQDLMASIADQIKDGQEQVAHLIAAEKQRAARRALAKPATPLAGAQPPVPKRPQPQPQ